MHVKEDHPEEVRGSSLTHSGEKSTCLSMQKQQLPHWSIAKLSGLVHRCYENTDQPRARALFISVILYFFCMERFSGSEVEGRMGFPESIIKL